MTETVRIAALIVAALSMSVHFGTWVTERPMRRTASGAVFTEVHQGRDATAARVMPVLGTSALALVAVTAILSRSDTLAFALGLVALAFFAGDMIITLTKNVPINKRVQGWAVEAPPADWASVRDRWERFHTFRSILVVTGFAFLAAAIVLVDA